MPGSLSKEFPEIFSIAIKAAVLAGDTILNIYFQDEFCKELKDDGTPITIADKEANKIILNTLKITNLPLVSEESDICKYSKRKNWEYYWLIDPIDGTKEFINRNDEFTVNIALINKDKPIAGIVYAPALKKFYFGVENLGSYLLNSNKLNEIISENYNLNSIISKAKKIAKRKELANGYKIAVSKSHHSLHTENFINKVKSYGKEIELIHVGSSLKLCILAEGVCNIYPRYGNTYEWDIAAGHAILSASGGEVYQINSKTPLKYNKSKMINPYFVAFHNKDEAEDFFKKHIE